MHRLVRLLRLEQKQESRWLVEKNSQAEIDNRQVSLAENTIAVVVLNDLLNM